LPKGSEAGKGKKRGRKKKGKKGRDEIPVGVDDSLLHAELCRCLKRRGEEKKRGRGKRGEKGGKNGPSHPDYIVSTARTVIAFFLHHLPEVFAVQGKRGEKKRGKKKGRGEKKKMYDCRSS